MKRITLLAFPGGSVPIPAALTPERSERAKQHLRIAARKRVYREARRQGAGHKTAKREAKRAWMWVDNTGNLLPLSNAPRCDFHPAWIP